MRIVLATALLLAATPSPAREPPAALKLPELPPGSNERLRTGLTSSPDLEVIVSDVVIAPGEQVPRHYHPGEEFLYLVEGSAVHIEHGAPDRPLRPGDALVIKPGAVHSPRAGSAGARAIVFRVHVKGQPERIPVPAAPAPR
ncbi:MAG: cupin domain-containing protein [Novosphingobium sp.]